MGDRVCWTDGLEDVVRGDITAAAAYLTPAGGTVVTAVAPCGIGQRDLGLIGFTTSLGFGKKLERIILVRKSRWRFMPVSTGSRPARRSCWLRAWPRWISGPRVRGWRR